MITAPPLTHVVGHDGEGFQVGFPDVLRQRVGVVLEVAEQMGGATFGPLDLIPVLLIVWIQDGAPCTHQVLEKKSTINEDH